MSVLRRAAAVLAILAGFTGAPMGVAQDLVPAKRFVITQDADLPGGDLSTQLDTTIEACERACLADQRCTHLTFNTRNGSCFTKANPGKPAFYQGAFSARVVATNPEVLSAAPSRRAA